MSNAGTPESAGVSPGDPLSDPFSLSIEPTVVHHLSG